MKYLDYAVILLDDITARSLQKNGITPLTPASGIEDLDRFDCFGVAGFPEELAGFDEKSRECHAEPIHIQLGINNGCSFGTEFKDDSY